jgi:hypothetical protein
MVFPLASGVAGYLIPGGFLLGFHPRNTVLLPPKYGVYPIALRTNICLAQNTG